MLEGNNWRVFAVSVSSVPSVHMPFCAAMPAALALGGAAFPSCSSGLPRSALRRQRFDRMLPVVFPDSARKRKANI